MYMYAHLNLLSHPANSVLEFLVSRVDPEGELERLLSLLLANLSQLPTKLVIFIIPGVEHSIALAHDLYQGGEHSA